MALGTILAGQTSLHYPQATQARSSPLRLVVVFSKNGGHTTLA
jgi:hypothetical protein